MVGEHEQRVRQNMKVTKNEGGINAIRVRGKSAIEITISRHVEINWLVAAKTRRIGAM